MAQRQICFLELSTNNRRAHVARQLGWAWDALNEQQKLVVDRIIDHSAKVANETMRQHVETLLALQS